jgi:hypothetical protein
MASLTSICYLVYWSICVAMMRSECKRVKHKNYDTEVVLMTNPCLLSYLPACLLLLQQQKLLCCGKAQITLSFSFSFCHLRSRGSVLGIATGYGLDDSEVGVKVLVGSRNFSFHVVQASSGARPVSSAMDTVILSLAVKRPGREADHSSTALPKSRKCGCIHPLPPYPLMASA